jgi:hypothetical protein
MIRMVDISLLPAAQRERVLVEYREALKKASTLSYVEAAWFYHYQYATLRHYVSRGMIPTQGRYPRRRITHAAMRAHVQNKACTGSPRKALKTAQLAID